MLSIRSIIRRVSKKDRQGSIFSVKLLDLIFLLFGVSKVVPEYTAFTFIGAVAFVSLCVLVFSFIVLGKVKRVEVRELVTE